jgi:hypothetical protein
MASVQVSFANATVNMISVTPHPIISNPTPLKLP